jgi:hypothetical protein
LHFCPASELFLRFNRDGIFPSGKEACLQSKSGYKIYLISSFHKRKTNVDIEPLEFIIKYSKLLALWWIMSSTTSYVLQNIINQQNQVFFYPLQQQQEHNNRQEFFDTVRASCCLYGTVPGKKQTNENTNRTDRKERVIIK